MQKSPARANNILSLQALRAIGAVLIFLHHSGLTGSTVTSFGDFAVCCFFMLSGYVLALKYRVFDTSEETACRPTVYFRNILPLVWACIKKVAPIYYLTLFAMLFLAKFTTPLVSTICSALMIQSWIPDRAVYFSLNSPSWFISNIIFCYAAFWPIVYCIKKLRKRLKITAILAVAIYMAAITIIPSESAFYLIYIFPPMQLPAFVIGMALCVVTANSATFAAAIKKHASFLIISAFGINIAAMLCYKYIPERFALSSYWWVFSALLTVVLALTDNIKCAVTRVLHNRFIIKAGNASMIFYLCHIPWLYVTRLLLAKLNIDLPPCVELPVSIILLEIISFFINKCLSASRQSVMCVKYLGRG